MESFKSDKPIFVKVEINKHFIAFPCCAEVCENYLGKPEWNKGLAFHINKRLWSNPDIWDLWNDLSDSLVLRGKIFDVFMLFANAAPILPCDVIQMIYRVRHYNDCKGFALLPPTLPYGQRISEELSEIQHMVDQTVKGLGSIAQLASEADAETIIDEEGYTRFDMSHLTTKLFVLALQKKIVSRNRFSSVFINDVQEEGGKIHFINNLQLARDFNDVQEETTIEELLQEGITNCSTEETHKHRTVQEDDDEGDEETEAEGQESSTTEEQQGSIHFK